MREVIFPAVGQGTLEALVREACMLGTPQARRMHTAVRASYGSYYRRMMPRLLAALEFHSNNGTHRPLLEALDDDSARRGRGATVLPRRRDYRRGRNPSEMARHRDRGRAGRRPAGEPDQLRDLRPADPARAAALQGGLGGGRRPVPQSRRGSARRLRRAAGGLLRAPEPARGAAGLHGCAADGDGRGADTARPRHAVQPGCAPRPAPAAPDPGQPARAPARAAEP